ncbi:MAG: hypothetical protein WEB00_09400 [Dehalococcoidia bacterium]
MASAPNFATKPPVLLVHGCGSTWAVWKQGWNITQVEYVTGGQTPQGAGWHLRRATAGNPLPDFHGAELYLLDWQTNVSRVSDLAYAVADAVKYLAAGRRSQVVVVSHSLGGLITRWYIQSAGKKPEYAGDVAAFYSIACPHNGSSAFGWKVFGLKIGDWFKEGYIKLLGMCGHAKEIVPTHETIRALRSRSNPLPAGPWYVSVGGDGCWFPFWGDTDGTFHINDVVNSEVPMGRGRIVKLHGQHNSPRGAGNFLCRDRGNLPWIVEIALPKLTEIYGEHFAGNKGPVLPEVRIPTAFPSTQPPHDNGESAPAVVVDFLRYLQSQRFEEAFDLLTSEERGASIAGDLEKLSGDEESRQSQFSVLQGVVITGQEALVSVLVGSDDDDAAVVGYRCYWQGEKWRVYAGNQLIGYDELRY